MVLTVSCALSPATGLSCHRRPREALLLKNLTPASGRQDHTPSPSASAPFVRSASASTASRPAAVTIANRPSVGQDGKSYSLICISEKQKYFCKGGWTGQSPTRSTDLPVRQTNSTSGNRSQDGLSFHETRRGRLEHDGYRTEFFSVRPLAETSTEAHTNAQQVVEKTD